MTATATRFDPDRLATLRAACVREWNREIEADPQSFRTLSGTIATGEGIWKEFSVHFMVGDGRQDIAYRLPIMGTFDSLIIFNEPRPWGDEAIASHEFSTP